MAIMEMDKNFKKMVQFYQVLPCVLEISLKLRLWLILSSKIRLLSSSYCLISIMCVIKVLSFNLGKLRLKSTKMVMI